MEANAHPARVEATAPSEGSGRGPLTVAVAQPACAPGDVAANAVAHAAAVRVAGARLVVFPELSLTGYDLAAPPVDPASPLLAPIVEACRATGAIALVGAVVAEGADRCIATLAVDAAGASVAYRKMVLGGDEGTVFTAGPTPARLDLDGWRIGLGICKDTGSAEQVERTVALGIDLYVAGLVHRPDELVEQDARAARIAAAGVSVAFASAAGPVGPDYPATAGHSCVWDPSGAPVARATGRPGEVVTATLDRGPL